MRDKYYDFIKPESKIFILEDNPNRIDFFKKKLVNNAVVFSDQVNDSIYLIQTLGPFDIYFLDHDLGGRVYVPSNEINTGYQLAKFLAKKNIKARFIIHTMNSTGARAMMSLLPDATYIPFCILVNSL